MQELKARVRRFAHEFVEIALTVHDVFSEDAKCFGLDAVMPWSYDMLCIPMETTKICCILVCTQLEIIARIARLLSTSHYKHTHVFFVGAFVCGESGVTMEAIGHILGCESSYCGVELRNLGYHGFGKGIKAGLRSLVFLFVSVKPLPIVVGLELL